jgi:hypothetical protein
MSPFTHYMVRRPVPRCEITGEPIAACECEGCQTVPALPRIEFSERAFQVLLQGLYTSFPGPDEERDFLTRC